MGEIKLKPCPFCGGQAKIKRYVNGCNEWSEIRCSKCGVRQDSIMNGYYKDDEATEAWNRRADTC